MQDSLPPEKRNRLNNKRRLVETVVSSSNSRVDSYIESLRLYKNKSLIALPLSFTLEFEEDTNGDWSANGSIVY